MIVFTCKVCRTALSAEPEQAGQLVRCPACKTAVRVPDAHVVAVAGNPAADQSSTAGAGSAAAAAPRMMPQRPFTGPRGGSGRRFGFNCGYCSSRLEATESQCAQDGQCPTCGNQITIPILDRQGRLIDPKTRQIIKQDPHPVHAYAAAGERAPKIVRLNDGRQSIICPRCSASCPISSNNCKSCGMPFTMEGTTLEAAGVTNGFCVAALVLGIISLPTSLFCLCIPSILAIIFGIVGLVQINRADGSGGGGKPLAISGLALGAIGIGLYAFLHQ